MAILSHTTVRKKNFSRLTGKAERTNSPALINEIVDQVEIGILFGEFKPREHLVQDQLAKRYEVERNVIRSVLKRLEERGVIDHYPNRGSIVKELSAKNAKDLYHLRFLLEGTAAEMAVAKMTPEIVQQLESLREAMEKNLKKGDLRSFTLDHEKFHQVIFETADNPYLVKVIKELRSASASIRNFSHSRYSLPETQNQLFDEHQRMIMYLKKGDGKKVAQTARLHIKAGINHYLKHFPSQENMRD
jgi:DNA-binding GntR family transcriptional regulator